MEPGVILTQFFLDKFPLRHEDGSMEDVRLKVDREGNISVEPHTQLPPIKNDTVVEIKPPDLSESLE